MSQNNPLAWAKAGKDGFHRKLGTMGTLDPFTKNCDLPTLKKKLKIEKKVILAHFLILEGFWVIDLNTPGLRLCSRSILGYFGP